MPRNNNRGGRNSGSRNNNPEGRNQYTSGWVGSARENPLTTAAAVGGAVAAGVFLWSRRNQITDQIGQLGDQISEWREGMRSDSSDGEFEMAGASGMSSGTSASNTSPRGMSETGSGNASSARSGGSGMTGSASGRGRARQSPTS